MFMQNCSNNRIFKKALSFIMTVVIAVSLLPAFGGTAYAEDGSTLPEFLDPNESKEDAAMNVMTVYLWHRVHNQNDLPKPEDGRVPFIIMWEHDGKAYYGNGGYAKEIEDDGDDYDAMQGYVFESGMYLPDPFDTDPGNDLFYSTELLTNWTMLNTGNKDKDNKSAYKCRIWTDGSLLTGYDDFDWEGARDSAADDQWTFFTHGLGGKYEEALSDRKPVKIFYNVSGADVGFKRHNDYIYGWENYHYNYEALAMYWAEPIKVSAITDDYTIGEGMVMNIKNGVILKDGVTLTIMPGGTLSIEGQFYQNGVINNYGTVLLQEDACITGFLPQKNNSGAILNSGEQVNTHNELVKSLDAKKNEAALIENKLRTYPSNINTYNQSVITLEDQLKSLLASKDDSGLRLDNKLSEYEDQLAELEYRGLSEEARLLGITVTGAETAEELNDLIAVYLDDDAHALTQEQIETLNTWVEENLTPVRKEYDELAAPKKQLEKEIADVKKQIADTRDLMESDSAKLNSLESEIKRLSDLIKEASNLVQGEGNLVVMKNARLVLNTTEQSRLTVKAGGSIVCNGYIIHPSSILISNSKVHIRKDGALLLHYALSKNVLNARKLTVKNQGTLNITMDGLVSFNTLTNNCAVVSDNYILKVDGILKYSSKPIYNASTEEIETIMSGGGAWDTDNSPKSYVDENGSMVYIDLKGNKTVTMKDGTIIVTDAATGVETTTKKDGTVIVKQPDGTAKETRADGSYINYAADGSIIDMNVKTDDGGVQTYSVSMRAVITMYNDGYKPGTEDVYKTVTYVDTGYTEYFHANSKNTEAYDKNGNLVYSHTVSMGIHTYKYADHVEKKDENGDLTYLEYSSGALKGAKIERSRVKNKSEAMAAELLWTVTSANGEITKCYLWRDFDYLAQGRMNYEIWIFANGKTCSTNAGEMQPEYFLHASNLMAAPIRFQYDKQSMVIPLSATAKSVDSGDYEHPDFKVSYSDGSSSVGYYTWYVPESGSFVPSSGAYVLDQATLGEYAFQINKDDFYKKASNSVPVSSKQEFWEVFRIRDGEVCARFIRAAGLSGITPKVLATGSASVSCKIGTAKLTARPEYYCFYPY